MFALTPSMLAHFERHPIDQDQKRALRAVQHGNRAHSRHADYLVQHGYARQTIGGVMLTDLGRVRLLARD